MEGNGSTVGEGAGCQIWIRVRPAIARFDDRAGRLARSESSMEARENRIVELS
jgi:hypothetical protein